VETILKVGVVFFKARISEDEKGLVGPHRKKTRRSSRKPKPPRNIPPEDAKARYQQNKLKKYGPKSSTVYKITGWFNIPNSSNVTKSGFKGARTAERVSTLLELKGLVKDRSILGMIGKFQQVPYEGVCTRVCDSEGNSPFDSLITDAD